MRKDSFKAIVGSHNYGLNTPESDKDYKIFFYPSFDDLYSGEKYSKAKTSDTEDVEYHDVRKLPDMLWKSNVNFVEVLFSQEVEEYDNLYGYLYDIREDIARMNLPYLYDACMGMFYKKQKEYERDILKGEAAKYNKHAMTAYRILDFLFRYQRFDFDKFQDAIRYHKEDDFRDFLFRVKKGEVHAIVGRLNNKKMLIEEIKYKYKEHEPDLDTKSDVYETVKRHVEDYIYRELR